MVQPSLLNPMRTLDRRSVPWAEQDLPFVASNNLTTFSILDTGTGTIASYAFDTRSPASAVVKFDEFSIV